MKTQKTSLQFLSWIVIVPLGLTGLSILGEDFVSGAGSLLLAIFFIPSVFDSFKFKFAKSKSQRRLCKVVIFLIGLIIIRVISAGIDVHYESQVEEIQAAFNGLEKDSDQLLELAQIESSIKNLPEKYLARFESITNDIRIYRSYYSGTNSLLSAESIVSKLSPGNLDSLYSTSHLEVTSNRVLNEKIVDGLITSIPTSDDFPSEADYYNFRFRHAKERENTSKSEFYFSKVLEANRKFDFDEDDVIYAIDKFYSLDGYDKKLYNYVRRNKANKFFVLLELSRKLFESEENVKAYEIIAKALKVEKDNKHAVRLAGNIAFARNHKKTTVRHFEHLNELKALDRESCEILRDLTRYVAGWNYYSICCDGSRSESTGRGTCSHHGGVCRSKKEPIYRFKYGYCG
jgi:hypothetical protein